MTHTRLLIIMAIVFVLLSIPLVAMQFTDQVNWSIFDFIVMGTLLLGTGLFIEFILRKVTRTSHRIVLCIAVLFVFLLIWAELAVGIFGTPFAGS